MIKKRAHKNRHRRIGTLDIGSLAGYASAMAGNLQYRGSDAQTKIGMIKRWGSDLLQASDN